MNNTNEKGALGLIVAVLILLILVVAGYYLLKGSRLPISKPTANIPVATQTMSSSINQDINSIDVGSVDNDLQSVDQDLKNL